MKKAKNMKNVLQISITTLVAATVLSACGKETTGDQVTRDCDRQREQASVMSQNYKDMNGTFSGAANNSDIFLVMTTSATSPDGGVCVPNPALVGSLVFAPRVMLSGSQDRAKVYFSFKNGTYDKPSADLSFSLE